MSWSYNLNDISGVTGAMAPVGDVLFTGVSTDSRAIQPGDLYVALKGERFDGADFIPAAFAKGAAAALATRATSEGPCLVVPDPLKALQQFAAWHRKRCAARVIALTGSCGKTSTKELIAGVLASRHTVVKTQGNLNNEIGCPLSLLKISPDTGYAVIEMGANHMGEIAGLCRIATPDESLITLVGPSHLEGFGSIENIARAKGEIVEALPAGGVFYVNTADPWCVKAVANYGGEKVRVGPGGDVAIEHLEPAGEGNVRVRIRPIGELVLPLACPAHAMNVAFAVAVGLRHGVNEFEEPLRTALMGSNRFKILDIAGRRVIDDTYNANPVSMTAAIDALAAMSAPFRMAMLGDMLELGEIALSLHEEIGRRAAGAGMDALAAKGFFAGDVVRTARESGCPRTEVVEDAQQAAELILKICPEGGAILIKGSRGMKMELVIEALRALSGDGQ